MINRNERGRRIGMRARLAVGAAVVAGGSAAGVLIAAAGAGPVATAQSTGFARSHGGHMVSEPAALSAALSGWSKSPAGSLTTLAQMTPMRTFSQVRRHGTTFAVQRGVVVLATKKFLVVKSANGSLHLWWLSGRTHFMNVDATMAGMMAMTGSRTASADAMMHGDMAPAATVMAGGTGGMTASAGKPTTITINTGGQVITITVTSGTATVTQTGPTGMPSTTPSMPAGTPNTTPAMPTTPPTGMPTPTVTATQPTFHHTHGVARGDLVLVAGIRVHGRLIAELVLFAAPNTTGMPTPSAPATASTTPTMSATPTVTPSSTVMPTATGTGAPTFTGPHS